MILGIAASQNTVSSPIDLHFGRCCWFCIYNTETGAITFLENPCHSEAKHAGLQVAEMLEQHGVTVVVAGRFGNKVVELLRGKEIQLVVTPEGKTVEDIINRTK
ncbi:NifB/NifX family molybdenum-iron cluster-binding protein [uncultured Acetobacteroides sp.]|uniref:NifB/NifX family molybdenum-iron cluster-binding protein n=1 Tax=uncultured Acetobacteroides sp. TaxID=1760811 RepID=UPI0029F4B6D2|nr:NifB/NifX family molybdenum-iron cluster-binding protein [uncultured Acetobacteroides sp.]